jgi:hypothetical protein
MRTAILLARLTACGRIDFLARSDAGTSDTSTVADAVVASGLIGWWKLDDGAATTAADSSGHGNPGTLSVDLSWDTGPRGGVLVIPDAIDNEQVDLGDPPLFHLSGSMSVAGWANFSSINPGSAEEVILGRDDNAHSAPGWALKGSEDCATEHFVLQILVAGPSWSSASGEWIGDELVAAVAAR